MPIFTAAPIFNDNIGQLISHEDLEILRQNVGYAEMLSYRMMPGFPSSGGVDTGTPDYYRGSGTFTCWFGSVRFRTGMTTLAVQGTSANPGSMTFKVYVNNSLVASVAPGSTWQTTWAITGMTDGQVFEVQVRVVFSAGVAPANAKYVVTAVYCTPIDFPFTWGGVPSFPTAWTATKLNQLAAAAEWVYNRASAVPIRPDLAILYGLGPFQGLMLPMYFGSVGRWFSNSEFWFAGQILNDSSPGLYLKVFFDGVLVYTSGNCPVGVTNLGFSLSLAGYSVGQQIEVGIYLDNTIPAAQDSWSYCRNIFNAMRSQVDTSAVYSSITATPIEDVTTSTATLAAYLNDLSAVVLAAHDRIVNTPAVFNRVWGVRRFFSRYNEFSDIAQFRGRPRFIRTGHRLTVRGRNVSIGYGPISVPPSDRNIFETYKFLNEVTVIDNDHDETKVVYLDSLPGLEYGTVYYLIGDVRWAEENII
jgi:hypothetical protein